MVAEDVRLGTSVQVLLDHRKPDRQGRVGKIKQRYGTRHYTAFDVLFSDGQSELFWDHQLEESQKPPSRAAPWWRWLFR
jgi:hypothetical protein